MPLRIFHIYGNKDNLGDWGSAEGVKQMIRERRSEAHFDDFFISYADLSENDVRNINKNYDFAVIGGGGLLYPRSKGLFLRLSEESLKKISIPIVLCAIGLNYELQDEGRVDAYLKRFVKVKGLFSSISVRDEFTRDRLRELGAEAELVPCPSVFINKSAELFALPDDDRRKVGIVPIPLGRFKTKERQLYLESIFSLVQENRAGFSFFLIGHHKQLDASYDVISASVELPIIYPVNPWQLMRIYEQMDFMVGSRGHMGMFGIGAGTPFLFLSYNIKCRALTEMIGYPKQFTIEPKEFSASGISRSFKEMVECEKEVIDLFSAQREAFKQKNEQYVQIISAIFQNYGHHE